MSSWGTLSHASSNSGEAMARYGTAIVFINMGGEMLYVLGQRLRAQGVAADKQAKALSDVVSRLTGPAFLSALFAHATGGECDAADGVRLRGLFALLCKGSIVRLNDASMEKLFDLMCVAVKLQLLSAHSVAAVTANHVAAMERMAQDDPAVLAGVAALRARLDAAFERMGEGELAELRMALLRFLQDRCSVIAMFVADGRQHAESGALCYRACAAATIPPGGERPGTVRYFNTAIKPIREDRFASGIDAAEFDAKPAGPPPGCDMFMPVDQSQAQAAVAAVAVPTPLVPPAPSASIANAPLPT
jgi:hypothetical protein